MAIAGPQLGCDLEALEEAQNCVDSMGLNALGSCLALAASQHVAQREVSLLDLNVGCSDLEDEAGLPLARPVLGAADTRLNKDARASSGSRNQFRAMAMFAVPLKKSLLCTPNTRNKATLGKKVAGPDQEKRVTRQGKHASAVLSLDDRATAVLLQAAGTGDHSGPLTDEMKMKFYEQLADPMSDALVGSMRQTFGLPAEGEGGLLALAADADA
jgi:hypothetical protein